MSKNILVFVMIFIMLFPLCNSYAEGSYPEDLLTNTNSF